MITTFSVPPVDTLIIVLTCPSPPSANVQGAPAEVALTSVIAEVISIAEEVEPSPVIDCDVCFRPINEGMLLKTFAA